MQTLAELARVEAILFGSSLAAVVLYQLLGGHMNLHGLLADKVTGEVSPGRIQLLIVTMVAAGAQMGALMRAVQSGSDVLELPTGSSPLAVFVASHALDLNGRERPFPVMAGSDSGLLRTRNSIRIRRRCGPQLHPGREIAHSTSSR
jgi:hypothetical protein